MKVLHFIHGLIISLTAMVLCFHADAKEVSEGGLINPIQTTSITAEGLQGVASGRAITGAQVSLFANNIYHISQQEGSILMPFVQMEGLVMKQKQINRLGTLGDPELYLATGSKTIATNPLNDQRWLSAQRYWLACHVDSWDQVRTLWDIRNAYSQAMAMSFGRLMDRVIIAAGLGTVCAGANGQTMVKLPNSQRFVATDTSGDFAGLNLNTLRRIRLKMKRTFASKKGEVIALAMTAEEADSLLEESKTTSRDYTTILTLMSGEISAFFGFVFLETQLIPYNREAINFVKATGQVTDAAAGATVATVGAGKALRCFAFKQDSICFGINQNIMGRVSERDDLQYLIQIYYAAEFGAVRKEEVKVVEILTMDRAVA